MANEASVTTKSRRNVGKSVIAKNASFSQMCHVACGRIQLQVQIPGTLQVSPLLFPSLSINSASFFHFFPIAFPTFPPENERRKGRKKQKRKWLAGEIAITVPEAAESGGRQEVQHSRLQVGEIEG